MVNKHSIVLVWLYDLQYCDIEIIWSELYAEKKKFPNVNKL